MPPTLTGTRTPLRWTPDRKLLLSTPNIPSERYAKSIFQYSTAQLNQLFSFSKSSGTTQILDYSYSGLRYFYPKSSYLSSPDPYSVQGSKNAMRTFTNFVS